MKRLYLLIILAASFIGCEKNTHPAFSDLWWHGYTRGKNTTMNIQFISDTEFKFEDYGAYQRPSYKPGIGKYKRDGNKVTFDFETSTGFVPTCSNMRLLSGEWNKYPIDPADFYKAKLKVKYVYWHSLTSTIETEREEHETTMTVGKKER